MKAKINNNEIISNLFEGVYFVDKEREITSWNNGAEQITGFLTNEVVHRKCFDNILNHVDENGVALCFNGCPLSATMIDGKPREANVYLQHKDGHRVPVIVRAIPVMNAESEIVGAMEFFSENKNDVILLNRIEKLRKESTEDPLTKVPNRRYLEAMIESKIREFQTLNLPFGIAFLDIDDFKKINDTYGHDNGDKILILISKTIQANLRNNDCLGRWGGEEFIIILSNMDNSSIKFITEKLRHLIDTSKLRTAEQEMNVTVSIGATVSITNDTSETIIKRADELMYLSKLGGKNKVTIG